MDTNKQMTNQPTFAEQFSERFVSCQLEGWKRGTPSMTKVELSKKLGILLDPDANRLIITDEVTQSIKQLVQSLAVQAEQEATLGRAQKNLWLELLPWHSYN